VAQSPGSQLLLLPVLQQVHHHLRTLLHHAAAPAAWCAANAAPLLVNTNQVGELSASQLRLSSGGGAINVQRLFALDAQLVSEGGPVAIGALYGVKVQLDSGRGPLSVGHMSCSGLAMLQSGGSSLAVDGLEGNASLISSGGDVKVGACGIVARGVGCSG
jgi:hypothetical protein